MKKIICLLILFTCLVNAALAQRTTAADIIAEGIKLHDKGDYEGAILQYKKALLLNVKETHAIYEMASSYFALKDYKKAIEYSNMAIASGSDYANQAYIIKGSAQDLSGKPLDAVKTYREGIGKYPKDHLLHYNLALTSFNLKKYNTTDEALMKALQLNPAHASSHLLLGYSMSLQGKRVKTILALGNFLLLEPSGTRSLAALELLEQKFKPETGKSQSVSDSDDFNTAELILPLLESSNKAEANKDKSANELFAGNMKSLFTILGELKEANKGFWWDYYVDFFYTMVTKDHTEAFSYYILQSKKDNLVYTWLEENKEKFNSFSNWYTAYKR